MLLIHILEIGKDCPEKARENKEDFAKNLKNTTAKRLELREQDIQEVIFTN